MTEISAAMVKQLREATGAGIMDCKRALVETDGDLNSAERRLRVQGIASAGMRADRDTKEGVVLTRLFGEGGAIVAVGCETEPVSKDDEFRAFAAAVLDGTFERGEAEAGSALEQRRRELIGRLGENIVIAGARRLRARAGERLADYIHPPGKIGALLVARGGSRELARQLAMHITWTRPVYATREKVPAAVIASKREILAGRPEVDSKPPEVRDRIVAGMLAKHLFAKTVLADQIWIHDMGLTVAAALGQGGLELIDYAWFSVD